MNITWNEVTWYSKLLALIVFVLAVTFGFYFGFRYEALAHTASCLLPASFRSGAPAATGFLEGQVTIGPVCPVERPGVKCAPTPAMYAAHPVLVFTDEAKPAYLEIVPGLGGYYRTELPAGRYVIDIKRSGIGAVRGVPAIVTVEPNGTVTQNIDIDTGIR